MSAPGKVSAEAVAIDRLAKRVEQMQEALTQLKGELATGLANGARERNLLALGLESRDDAIEKLAAHQTERDAAIANVFALDTLHPPTDAETQKKLEALANQIAKVMAPDLGARLLALDGKLEVDRARLLRLIAEVTELEAARLEADRRFASIGMQGEILDRMGRLLEQLTGRVGHLETAIELLSEVGKKKGRSS